MRSVEAVGRTREEALRRALEKLGAREEEVEVEVLEEGPRALWGLLGRARVKVRVTIKEEPPERARGLVQRLLDLMGAGSKAEVASKSGGEVRIDIKGGDLSTVIGKGGRTLEALQYLVNLMLARAGEGVRVVLDADGYRRRREEALRRMAKEAARRALREGRAVKVGPLPAHERRIIHLALSGDPRVITYSEGEEPQRRVVVAPRRGRH
ncbi:MAG TPA: KH domain-containing protein [Armatimonadetes bacterium]|nr:KH domain-containing protein [Armatimonadota bacterium]